MLRFGHIFNSTDVFSYKYVYHIGILCKSRLREGKTKRQGDKQTVNMQMQENGDRKKQTL